MRAILVAIALPLLLSACVAGAAIRAGTTAAKADDQLDCAAMSRDLRATGIDPMNGLEFLRDCTEYNLVTRDQADRGFSAGARALRDGAAAWQPPAYTRPRALYCAPSGDGGFVCQ